MSVSNSPQPAQCKCFLTKSVSNWNEFCCLLKNYFLLLSANNAWETIKYDIGVNAWILWIYHITETQLPNCDITATKWKLLLCVSVNSKLVSYSNYCFFFLCSNPLFREWQLHLNCMFEMVVVMLRCSSVGKPDVLL